MHPSVYRERLARLVTESGGLVEDDRFVLRPGVLVVSASQPTDEAMRLLDTLGLDQDLAPAAQVAAFDARVTYLTFPAAATGQSGVEYLERVIGEKGHTSIVARAHASILFAGISLEDSIELIAGRAGRSARLTSSDTRAQCDTLYCLRGNDAQRASQRAFIQEFLHLRDRYGDEALGGMYVRNMLNLGNRAALLHMGMCVEDWHGLFRGRLQVEGNEAGVREAFARACALLHTRFPYIIREPSYYGFTEVLP